MEPKYPGLVERYVNLGDCYDRAGLQPLRQELMGCILEFGGGVSKHLVKTLTRAKL